MLNHAVESASLKTKSSKGDYCCGLHVCIHYVCMNAMAKAFIQYLKINHALISKFSRITSLIQSSQLATMSSLAAYSSRRFHHLPVCSLLLLLCSTMLLPMTLAYPSLCQTKADAGCCSGDITIDPSLPPTRLMAARLSPVSTCWMLLLWESLLFSRVPVSLVLTCPALLILGIMLLLIVPVSSLSNGRVYNSSLVKCELV